MSEGIMKVYICSKCRKMFRTNIVTVTKESSKNRLGRIAWGRDAVCNECAKREGKKDDR
jgi:DNA-directed RNA polymerase subunit RPC12/RpoP